MSILRSMHIGVSGLRAHAEALGVTGDNISNVNTVGFKQSRVQFEDMIGTANGIGGGTRIDNVQESWAQGALLATDVETDMAISGDGLFVVEGSLQGNPGRYYSRAGQFHLEKEGYLVNSDGLRVQGYNMLDSGVLSSATGDLQISANAEPSPTAEVEVSANLNAEADILPAFSLTDPLGTSNFSTEISVYDSLGAAHDITIFFRRDNANSWEWFSTIDGGELSGGTAGTLVQGDAGTLTFGTNGGLTDVTSAGTTWDFVNATAAQAITFDFGTPDAVDGGFDGTTQFASSFTTNALSQDGLGVGNVAGLSIAQDGTIMGLFSNGERRAMGQIALATFRSLIGLERVGQDMWTTTISAGDPIIGTPGSGGLGSVFSSSLEQSNVDLGTEFVNLISFQRGFQANSKVITTADEMFAELVNIKR